MFCWLAELLTEFWLEDFWEFLVDDFIEGICSHGADFCAPAARAKGGRAKGCYIRLRSRPGSVARACISFHAACAVVSPRGNCGRLRRH